MVVLPNPAVQGQNIRFVIPAEPAVRPVSLEIFDIAGNVVKRAIRPGPESLTWDECDQRGSAVPPGVYGVRIRIGKSSSEKSFVLTQ
jgi:flagellar hook assembly protein FlgD